VTIEVPVKEIYLEEMLASEIRSVYVPLRGCRIRHSLYKRFWYIQIFCMTQN
jgi:hypothetical protein